MCFGGFSGQVSHLTAIRAAAKRLHAGGRSQFVSELGLGGVQSGRTHGKLAIFVRLDFIVMGQRGLGIQGASADFSSASVDRPIFN